MREEAGYQVRNVSVERRCKQLWKDFDKAYDIFGRIRFCNDLSLNQIYYKKE